MKNIERNYINEDQINKSIYELKLEILNTDKENSRKLEYQNYLSFETENELKEYTKRNNISYDERNVLTDKRSNKKIILGCKVVENETELLKYVLEIEKQINNLRK